MHIVLKHIFLNPWWCCAPPRHLYGLGPKSFKALAKKLSLTSFKVVFHSEPFGACIQQSLLMLMRKPLRFKHLVFNMVGLFFTILCIPLDILRVIITKIFPSSSHQISFVLFKVLNVILLS